MTGRASAVAYGMILTLTLATWGLAGFGREKVCTWMCPWPRLQGAIWDPKALTVAYRDHRGEQRMSAKKAAAARAAGTPAGDCVDCLACVAVCPMGIDIREGPSIACINCGLCVDACDTTMAKLERPRGLIDYESWENIERGRRGEARRRVPVVRPKTVALAAAALGLVAAMVLQVAVRDPISLSVLHDRTPLAVLLSAGDIRNGFEIRAASTTGEARELTLAVEGAADAVLAVGGEPPPADGVVRFSVDGDSTRRLRVTVTGGEDLAGDLVFRLADPATGAVVLAEDRFHLP